METDRLLLEKPNHHSHTFRQRLNLPRTNAETCLDFIDFHKDGGLVIGSSSITGHYWDGSLAFYPDYNPSNPFERQSHAATLKLSHGVNIGRFLNNNPRKLITGEDDGGLKFLSIVSYEHPQSERFEIDNHIRDHHGAITDMSLSTDDRFCVTSCTSGLILMWDLFRRVADTAFEPYHKFNNAHNDSVTSVDIHNNNLDIFASCSLDREALLWDVRLNKPANEIYTNEFCGLTQVKWHPLNEHIVAIATLNGDIYFVDVRRPFEFLSKNTSSVGHAVHRIKFNSAGLLAVISDDIHMRVIDCGDVDDSVVVYHNSSHEHVVRDFTWLSDTSGVSCGWDGTVMSHTIG